MRARSTGIILDTFSLGIVCLLLAVLASEIPIGWRLVAISILVLLALLIIIGWAYYQRLTRRQALDCRYHAMVDRVALTSRDPWPNTPQLLDRHVFGGQALKK